jgi:hypothetical protein
MSERVEVGNKIRLQETGKVVTVTAITSVIGFTEPFYEVNTDEAFPFYLRNQFDLVEDEK